LLKAYPNPASNTLKVTYNLPQNVKFGVLQVFDNSGRPVNQFVVDHFSDQLDLDVSKMARGIYHYFIEYGDKKSPSKKLVIQ
jgi:hypothetical protein